MAACVTRNSHIWQCRITGRDIPVCSTRVYRLVRVTMWQSSVRNDKVRYAWKEWELCVMGKCSEDRSKVVENYPYGPWRYDSKVRVVRQDRMR